MKKVLGIGNALADMIVFMESDEMLHELNIPKGSMQLVDKELSLKIKTITSTSERHFESGGSAANTIHGLARLGVETGFIGTVGNDETGDFFISDMEKSGINSHILRGKLPTGLAISLVSPDSERTFATYLGSASEIKNEGIDKVIFSRYNHLHLEGYLAQDQNMFANAVMLAKECGLSVSLDLASYNVVEANIDFLVDIITKGIDLVFANENEAHALTGKADPEEALFSIQPCAGRQW
jgi:sugar/nucleoside kinase (ribokinase family)